MQRFLLKISFDGTNFAGWQIQNNALTVQGALQTALCSVVGPLPSSIVGCSRTDSGVHANEFCLHFDSNTEIPEKNILKALNARLPKEISAVDVLKVSQDFHARFDCVGKEYIYKIYTSDVRDPFKEDRFLHYPYHFNLELLNECAKKFIGEHDFKAFCAAGSSVKTTNRTIFDCKIRKAEDHFVFHISGDGFLYNMVRIIVGTLLEVNEGKILASDIENIILSGDRNLAGRTVKPHGLYLNKVFYNNQEIN